MPATPLTTVHLDEMDTLEDAIVALVVAVARTLEAMSAGKLTATDLDQGRGLIVALLTTFRATAWVERTKREIEDDRRRLRRWTPTGYDLDTLKGGRADDDEAA